MCFSATASFVAAGATALIGGATLYRVDRPRALLLASMPIVFAVQQGIEGALWLTLPVSASSVLVSNLSFLFLFFAYVFWPIYVPITILLLEPTRRLRRSLLLCLVIGLALGAHLFWWLLTHRHAASIQEHHIVYETGYRATVPVALAYLSATGLPLVLSSRRWVLSLGVVILVGSIVAYLFYWDAFVSVWCFVAAAASAVIFGHFQWMHSVRFRHAGT